LLLVGKVEPVGQDAEELAELQGAQDRLEVAAGASTGPWCGPSSCIRPGRGGRGAAVDQSQSSLSEAMGNERSICP
jgi:hypothetical protein